MRRYIDANILRPIFQTWYESFDWCDGETEKHTIATAIRTLDAMQTADVVEVVRCKDCKYMCHYTDGHLECRLLSDLKPIPTTYCTMNADDFCSYGERREDAEAINTKN